jgi:KDO2-lipid IV(A) lauroyltransferase
MIRAPEKTKKRRGKKVAQNKSPIRTRRKVHHIYAPALWPTWILVGFAWLITRLPITWIFATGRGIGNLLYRVATPRRLVTETNIARCFEELSSDEQADMVRQVFQQVSIGTLELMIPWLNPKRDLSARITVHGREHLEAAKAQGRGVILVGAHYAVMDVISQPLADCGDIDVMYRFNKNSVWEWLQVSGRSRYFDGVIEREDIRQTVRRLKQGRVLWYAADQDYGPKHSEFAPFFGVQAATIVATSRFARLNNSPVLLLRQTRDNVRQCWDLTFSPIIEDFPSDNDAADAARMNALLEAEIRHYPDQYLWLHKRFKTRPQGEPPFYPPKS